MVDGLRRAIATWESRLRLKNVYLRNLLAEFLGTFVMMVFGIASVAQSVLGRRVNEGTLPINLSWGWGVSMGVWTAGGVSGAHLNPSITTTMVMLGKLPARQLPVYWVGQYLGSFTASACVYGVYYDALNAFDGGIRSVTGENATAGIWATYPQEYLSTASGLGDQIFGTAMLVLCIMGISDARNSGPSKQLAPFVVGGLVVLIGNTLGLNCGYAINPARDLSPRLFTLAAGWGTEVFSAYDYWFWVPIVGPHIGAMCGALIYQIFVGLHIPTSSSPPATSFDVTVTSSQASVKVDNSAQSGLSLNETVMN